MVTTSMRWPSEVDQALDALVTSAGALVPRASRARLLAALVVELHAGANDVRTGELLRQYAESDLPSLNPSAGEQPQRLGRPRG